MQIIRLIPDMQRTADALRAAGRRIGFVPTMGYLHEGHASLIRHARTRSDAVVVSIFVNPRQFGPGEDYQGYPRDLDRDLRLIRETGGDIVFIPAPEEMYPVDFTTSVHVEGLTEGLCGASRPAHFRGVTTVVTKLFTAVKPHLAVFGQKDAQQALVIRRVVRDLNLDLEVLIAPTVREPDGLAMSSRNVYLTPEERPQAAALYQALRLARRMAGAGEQDAQKIIRKMRDLISERPGARIDYVSIVDTGGLKPVDRLAGEVLVAVAVRFGRARLIDNVILNL
ncbi:MAG: pantoate--beta-alanine ligase [Candidatus Handelsmanbacteria bacterium RIFCSPLOWO2_12_FULL_64_10]|uniref:Pantothenate synthetase n=1 Tax=Handelsmanbacteria sp. (strain RIFCSPLOWO2_12_FULL_64_10) TaxID=1817868 RepID=A0A1F6D3Y2_HANXR|nr:MAG: pantoate--beta-alanine ligase [Candidatus Handelsmanbacteria bacterium RIFCSPLOWO2_12_FULL_64_10]